MRDRSYGSLWRSRRKPKQFRSCERFQRGQSLTNSGTILSSKYPARARHLNWWRSACRGPYRAPMSAMPSKQTGDAMNVSNPRKLQRPVLWKACLLFMLVSGLLITTDRLSIRYGLDGSHRIVDDLLGGLIAGAIFHLYERRRLRRLCERLQVIDLMNHHIRNALQPLMLATYQSESNAQIQVVEECARRIDWALREILPGNSTEQFVAQNGTFGRSGSALSSPAISLSVAGDHWTQTVNSWPKPFFSRWLHAWRSRNEGIRR
jgi:hypothetical protein